MEGFRAMGGCRTSREKKRFHQMLGAELAAHDIGCVIIN
jgi:hypothetical protein